MEKASLREVIDVLEEGVLKNKPYMIAIPIWYDMRKKTVTICFQSNYHYYYY